MVNSTTINLGATAHAITEFHMHPLACYGSILALVLLGNHLTLNGFGTTLMKRLSKVLTLGITALLPSSAI